MTDFRCPIWGTPAVKLSTTRDGSDVSSPRAGGRYFIGGSAVAILEHWNDQAQNKVLLTSWLVEQRRLGNPSPEILSATLDEAKKRRPASVSDRADSLLRFLRSKSNRLGTIVSFYESDDNIEHNTASSESLAWTGSEEMTEVVTLAEFCQEERWITRETSEEALLGGDEPLYTLMLRPPGYARLTKLDGTNADSKQAFVAMWFGDSVMDAYDKGLAPAIREAGYEPLRIDRTEHNGRIDDEIIAEIRRSRFLVADFTQGADGARGGVYYEAGFAHGLNIPVIFTCRNDAIDKVHFDTRQYNHIVWASPDDLKERLMQRISATLGDGPLKNDHNAGPDTLTPGT